MSMRQILMQKDQYTAKDAYDEGYAIGQCELNMANDGYRAPCAFGQCPYVKAHEENFKKEYICNSCIYYGNCAKETPEEYDKCSLYRSVR